MTTTPFDQYYANLLADLAYVNFGPVPPGPPLDRVVMIDRMLQPTDGKAPRFTQSQAKRMKARFELGVTADWRGLVRARK